MNATPVAQYDIEVKAPFPWFGGKRRVAAEVWEAFGPDVPNYIEPFAGSMAVLLARPGGAGKIETVNDIDRMVANFWRAVSADPDGVAAAADWPVSEACLHARHKWLVNQVEFRERMHVDPHFFDVKIAGWWVWGICQWIGGGWCVEPQNHKHPKLDGIGKGVHSDHGHNARARGVRSHQRPAINDMGVHRNIGPRSRGANRSEEANRPDLAGAGRGVHSERGRRGSEADWRKRPELDGTSAGRGVHSDGAFDPKRQLPALAVGTSDGVGSGGRGVHGNEAAAYSPGRRPQLSGTGQGVHLPALGNDRGLNGVAAAPCIEWFRALQQRLRRVRVACGDWKRVLGNSVLGKGKNVGGRRPCAVFLDPPYAFDKRDPYLYAEDSGTISAEVRKWAIEHGDDPELRIALCGYEGEHIMPASWRCHSWKAARGYASAKNENRALERIWFSPHCLRPGQTQGLLFDVGAGRA